MKSNRRAWERVLWTWRPRAGQATWEGAELCLESAYKLVAERAFAIRMDPDRLPLVLPILEEALSVEQLVRLISEDLAQQMKAQFGLVQDLEAKCRRGVHVVRQLLKFYVLNAVKNG